MRIKTFHKKLIWLTEKDYKKILTRFNYHKYFKDLGLEMKTTIECPLCNKYDKICPNCQLHIFKKDLGFPCGCEQLITDILNVKDVEFFITWEEIGYNDRYKKDAEKQLDKLTKYLKSFEKISLEEFRRIKNEKKR